MERGSLTRGAKRLEIILQEYDHLCVWKLINALQQRRAMSLVPKNFDLLTARVRFETIRDKSTSHNAIPDNTKDSLTDSTSYATSIL